MGSYGFSEDANADLDEICAYLELRSPKVASRLFDRIREKCKLIAAFPEMGRSYEEIIPGLSGFVIDNYVVFYVIIGDSVQILRIVSGYRDIKEIFEQQ
jgi:toxin ParE1/3/4